MAPRKERRREAGNLSTIDGDGHVITELRDEPDENVWEPSKYSNKSMSKL